MGNVDDPHDPEHERHADGILRIQAAQQQPLYNGVDPVHLWTPKYAAAISSRLTSDALPVSVIRPSSRQ